MRLRAGKGLRMGAALAALTLLIGTASSAMAADPSLSRSLSRPGGRAIGAEVVRKIPGRAARENGRMVVFIELTSTPAIDAATSAAARGASAARTAGAHAKQQINATAGRVMRELRSHDRSAQQLYRTRNALAGIAVIADAAALRQLAARSDVRSIRTMTPKHTDNAHAAQLTRVLATWQSTGLFGDGIRVGIIDTGIDYTHANFAGPGTPEAYEAIDPTDATGVFPTAKVVGGTDFAGDDYDADSDDPAINTPVPDDNPLDCNGHGSHVAGTAAGFGVNDDGSTFDGDYSTLTGSDLNAMTIGPGMAPMASLYALKVFGCEGSTFLTAEAMDWALDPNGDSDFSDDLDVVNLSLGSDYGAPDDPESSFVKALVNNNVLVVFSSGNGGDFYDVGGSPGNTPHALTVANTIDSYELFDAGQVIAPASVAGIYPGQYSVALDYDTVDVTALVANLTEADNLDGCDPLNAPDAARVTGKFAWLEWDDNDSTRRCGSVQRAGNAVAAGAIGAIFTSTLNHFSAGITGSAVVPVIQLTGDSTDALRTAMEAGTLAFRMRGDLRQSFDSIDPSIEDMVNDGSSRGVHLPSVKPDVAAPGTSIVSTGVGTGDGPLSISGTSMAAPHVAGIGALLREAHPDWSAVEVKTAIMNMAGHDIYSQPDQTGPIHAPNRVGAGRVDAEDATGNRWSWQGSKIVPSASASASASWTSTRT